MSLENKGKKQERAGPSYIPYQLGKMFCWRGPNTQPSADDFKERRKDGEASCLSH